MNCEISYQQSSNNSKNGVIQSTLRSYNQKKGVIWSRP